MRREFSTTKAISARVRRSWDARRRPISLAGRPVLSFADDIRNVLAADHFAPAAVERFARREAYPGAVAYLQHVATGPYSNGLIPLLWTGATAWRIAVYFGAIEEEGQRCAPFTIEDLRVLSSYEAKLALVALGEFSDWSALDRRGRAVVALRYLIALRRELVQ
ncbi:hypothetical protein [Bradyrhizobium sp. S3.2.12]|uniref:hypothetical protein n=1 Tax=Bradyrhizobium sp. S3.2.12 TaxID=3156387 RepID=UPI00339AEC3C